MRELQRRWRNTVRIDEKLYAPDEMLDRAVLDNQGEEIGVITGLFRVKRTYKGVVVTTRMRMHALTAAASRRPAGGQRTGGGRATNGQPTGSGWARG